jgi:hypothetical protein
VKGLTDVFGDGRDRGGAVVGTAGAGGVAADVEGYSRLMGADEVGTLTVNLHGDSIGKAVNSAIVYELEHSTSAPAPNGLPNWPTPDARHKDH